VTGGPQTANELRVAGSNEPEPSASIIEEVAAWGEAEGMPSWSPGSFTGPDSVGVSRLRGDIAHRGLYLIWQGARAIGTFSLLESDPIYWPDGGDAAMYLHRFAVSRAAAGAGAGRFAVAWCLGETRRRGRSHVRLDCLADNPGILRYYERLGFTAVDEVVITGTRYSLYEIPVIPPR
jgi:GNAT superfamily N-acetyltransferase